MQKEQLFAVLDALQSLSAVKSVKFAYAIAKNKKLIEAEIETIREVSHKLSEEDQAIHQEFMDKRNVIVVKYAEKDEKGNPVMTNNQYKITDIDACNAELKTLGEEYLELFEALSEVEKSNAELLQEDSDIDFVKIKLDTIPEETSATNLEVIMELIEE